MLEINTDYKSLAKESLVKAELFFNQNDSTQLKYAILELRLAIEALTYARAIVYIDEIHPTSYRTWHPKKLMELLLNIDPNADKTVCIGIGKQSGKGKKAEEINHIGTQKIFNLQRIKNYYSQLGSFLHLPSLAKASISKSQSHSNATQLYEKVFKELTDIVNSNVINFKLFDGSSVTCENCGHLLKVRKLKNEEIVITNCLMCEASYKVSCFDEKQDIWEPNLQNIVCLNPACNELIPFWDRNLEKGKWFKCPKCELKHLIDLTYLLESI